MILVSFQNCPINQNLQSCNSVVILFEGYLCPSEVQWLQSNQIQVQEQQKRKCSQSVRDHNCRRNHLRKITQVLTVQQQKQDLQIKETDWWKILSSENRVLNTLGEDLFYLVIC